TDLVDRDGLAVDGVAAGGDRVRALAGRRVAAIARGSSLLTTEAAHLRGFCVFGAGRIRGVGCCFRWRGLFLAMLMLCFVRGVSGQDASPQKIADGVWFLIGDSSKGYSNTTIVEMESYLIVVDANYPARAKELLTVVKGLSKKPVRFVFDTHAHGDHSYGNSVWTAAGATTMAFRGVVTEMDRWEPARWQAAMTKRQDVRETGEVDVQRPQKVIDGDTFVLKDKTREVRFLFLGWGHTPGDGYVWLPKERVLCTGDAAVNGPRNKLLDANIANWPDVLDKALALKPLHVLPGHGAAGGAEILSGQAQFLRDLYREVKLQADAGKTPAEMQIKLPDDDSNWVPNRPDGLQQDVETVYLELTSHAPAGSVPHVWK
ncbi:MAG TPA: MBL fold metallo-hydrolase, partial [Edaphobacter sp.]|nr:MBL fold metallo-hydrolase [Edaphobacter sp.]